jgi:hypothetical protein
MSIFVTRAHSKGLRTGLTGMLLFLLLTFPAFAADKMRMACEVLEISGTPMTQIEPLREIHFMVIHHANAADRETLSRWLKANSGTEVRFTVAGKVYHGVLHRLPHCFGRGLLLYAREIRVNKKDIIQVDLPPKSLQ